MSNAINQGKGSKCSYLLEVVATNQFHGQHILLQTYREGEQLGVRPGSIRANSDDKPTVIRGMTVLRVPSTNAPIPGQQDIIDHFLAYPMMYNIRHRPVIGEITTGHFIGKKIAMFTTDEIHQYFAVDAVRGACVNQSVHANVQWCEAPSFAEAEKYYTHPDRGYLLSLVRRRYRYLEEPLTRTQYIVFGEQVRQVAVGMKAWHENDISGKKRYTQHWETLAKLCHQLDNAIQCRAQYERLKDTLSLCQAILVKERQVKPVLFIGHCKILERVAEETLSNLPVR